MTGDEWAAEEYRTMLGLAKQNCGPNCQCQTDEAFETQLDLEDVE